MPDSSLSLTVRSPAEREAYMAGQRSALKLAREKGVEYAERIIEAAQATMLDGRALPPEPPVGASGEHTPRGRA